MVEIQCHVRNEHILIPVGVLLRYHTQFWLCRSMKRRIQHDIGMERVIRMSRRKGSQEAGKNLICLDEQKEGLFRLADWRLGQRWMALSLLSCSTPREGGGPGWVSGTGKNVGKAERQRWCKHETVETSHTHMFKQEIMEECLSV